MGRPQNTRERREQIVNGLARVMAEQGYAKATVQSIARAAGLTPGLLHYHFGSKQEILLALVDRLAATVRARLDPQVVDGRERLLAAIDALVGIERGIDSDSVACWVVIGAEAVRQPEVRALYASAVGEIVAVFVEAFRVALRQAGRAEATAEDAALSVVAAIEGFFRLAAGAPDCVPPGSAARSARQIALGYLSAAEAAP